jgi:hypothetical protein
LTAKFVAVTFRQEDKAAATPEKPGAAAGAPSGAAPPMPSAGTPAGAKARTEDALQKGEDRTKNAGDADRLKGGL